MLWIWCITFVTFQWRPLWNMIPYFIEYRAHFFFENDAEIFPTHYTWMVAEKGLKMAFMVNKLAMIDSWKVIFAKNHCEIQVRIILECTLYSINTVIQDMCCSLWYEGSGMMEFQELQKLKNHKCTETSSCHHISWQKQNFKL